jgi:hypothetical protein
MRVLHGLGGLPRSMALDDPRLPHVDLGPERLRLNSHKLPPGAFPADPTSHAERMAALRSSLHASCGHYDGAARGFIDGYLGFIAGAVERHRVELAGLLAPFDGVYAVEDWMWSALRPLPRAWAAGRHGWVPLGIAFWTGSRLLVTAAARGFEDAVTITEADLAAGSAPAELRRFWAGERLPSTPFGRDIPAALPG